MSLVYVLNCAELITCIANIIKFMGRWQSGQLHQTVNLTPHGYAGSNPALPKLGPLAHLARAPALHAGGDEFDSRRVQIFVSLLFESP